jgi:hypothetical protein
MKPNTSMFPENCTNNRSHHIRNLHGKCKDTIKAFEHAHQALNHSLCCRDASPALSGSFGQSKTLSNESRCTLLFLR